METCGVLRSEHFTFLRARGLAAETLSQHTVREGILSVLPCLEKRRSMERRGEAIFPGSFPAPALPYGIVSVGSFTFQADSHRLTGFQRLYPPSDRQPQPRALRSFLTRSCLHASSWIAHRIASLRTTLYTRKYPWNLNGQASPDSQPRLVPLIPAT